MAIGEPLFSGGSKLGKTTINWGLSSKPSLMTPEGNRIWQWYTKLWYRSFDPWIGVKKKKHVDPLQGLVKELRMNGKTLLGGFFCSFSVAKMTRSNSGTQAILGWNQVWIPSPKISPAYGVFLNRSNTCDQNFYSDIWYWKGTNYSCLDINRFIISPLISH